MKSVEEIYGELLEAFGRRAGFVPTAGCDLAVRLWAAAAQVQALQIQAEWVLDQSFPQTAQGIYLDRHAAMRGIGRSEATRAKGVLRFSVTSAPAADVVVPAETVCMTPAGVRFITTAAATLQGGSLSADAPAQAVESGSAGNAVPGAIHILTACPVAVTGVSNPAAFTGGADTESDEALRERVLESYRRLPNGANAAWYEQTAMNHPGVTSARAVGRARGIGTVDVYVSGENGLPGTELLEALQAELQEKREIAVDVQVKAPEVHAVEIQVEIQVREGMDFSAVKTEAEQALIRYFSQGLLGKPVRLAELGGLIYALEGVENYRFSQPAADLPAVDAVLPVLGALGVTEMGA